MKYMLLIYNNEAAREAMSPEERQRSVAQAQAIIEEMSRRGIFRGADPLQPTSTATTVRRQDGKVLITDGPFAPRSSLPGTSFWTVKIWTKRWNGPRSFPSLAAAGRARLKCGPSGR